MRVTFILSVLLLGCGGPEPAPRLSSEPASAPVASPTSPPASPPASSLAPTPALPTAEPAEAAPVRVESCEGLVMPCGGWDRCVHVFAQPPSGDGAVRFTGIGDDVGHLYLRDDRCVEGVCNDMCDPSTSSCRHGVREELPTACSRAAGPSPAPFYCELVAGSCVRHDLPPPGTHARS